MVIFCQVDQPLRFVSQFAIAMMRNVCLCCLLPVLWQIHPFLLVASSSPNLTPSSPFSLFLLFQTLLFFDFSYLYS